jgi:hypothetical protein
MSTFDTTNALSGMFLWIIFGYLATLLNCDLQRFLRTNPLWIHAFGLTAFFFLFTILDANNKSVYQVWLKTLMVYILFVLMTKSKWYFIVPVIILLLVDQTIKKDLAFRKSSQLENLEQYEEIQEIITRFLNICIIVLILIGAIHYAYIQKRDHTDFTWFKFLFTFGKCRK